MYSAYKLNKQVIVIHTIKGCGIVNKAEIDVFLELSCFFHDPADVGNLISVFRRHLKGSEVWVLREKEDRMKIALPLFNIFKKTFAQTLLFSID